MDTSAFPHPPPYTASASREPTRREDWEDWEDDEPITPIDAGEQVLIGAPPPPLSSTRATKPSGTRSSRISIGKVKRLKSRHRQKTQNAQAGIRLITDMTTFRRQTRQLRNPDGRPVKFVDAAALKALEGEPTSASVGNWNWIRKNKTQSPAIGPAADSPQQPPRSPDQQLSPEDRPIVIGIAMPSDEMNNRDMTPQTTTVANAPNDLHERLQAFPNPPTTKPTDRSGNTTQQQSVWSPDTPDTASSWTSARYTSSVYSRAPSPGAGPVEDVPPVPAVPANFKKAAHQRLISLEMQPKAVEEDDSGTPCTLFEEDGLPSPQNRAKGKASAFTPDSAASKSHGWWDHVVTPFMEKRLSFASRRQMMESPKERHEDEWWSGSERRPAQSSQHLTPTLTPNSFQTPIVRIPTPRRTPSPRPEATLAAESGPSTAISSPAHAETSPVTEKPRIVITDEVPAEQPPPYSPPQKEDSTAPVRYRAVFPPGHPLNADFPPSPGPVSPGLSATMTSQGATQMTEIPLTPAPRTNTPLSQMALPTRALGTFVPPGEITGQITKAERQRRRHEKEEVVARRAGGFWRGRGCIPKNGCFGRSGREGRQRRRVWMTILGIAICLIILVVTLAVVLTRPHDSEEIPSIWVNLTDFPPMPTGVLTVVGPDNTVSKDSCTEPSTMWSCSLPKEQHDSVSPYEANQPTVIMQIQWDNSTQNKWNVSDGDAPTPLPRRSVGGAALAGNAIRERSSSLKFNSNPNAPDFQEMWFLGNTTDDIKSDDKGGEPTPFYISLLDSLDSVETEELGKRATAAETNVSLPNVLPSPDLNADGTPKSAVMLPTPVQQPVRLYDRGLPTEHYGFYSYFKRTIYLKSVTVLNETDKDDVPLDKDGGCKESEADFLTTWSETRVLVQIWTQTLDSNTSSLLSSTGQTGINGTEELIRPGTMPYPVTVSLDTHGGDATKKFVWAWPINDRQELDEDNPKLLANNIGVGGTWINKRSRGDDKYGGFDGGTGGCKCQWVNWVGRST
ncbi:hypothetical protein QQZ08_000574 [Neonectria magnoliae]|uniref:Glycoprotease family protein n=1 Tax=Neonectria magnoliae TaxID=2732573 RepID=A0ABR1IHQ2_9HYPO